MTSNIYLDLVENPIKNWIALFCGINIDVFDYMGDQYCLLFPEIVNGEKKCIMLYVCTVYPPFENISFKIKKNKYLDTLLKALNHYIKMFYMSSAKTLLEDRSKPSIGSAISEKLQILENTGLANDICSCTLFPYPIDKNYIENNKKLYDHEFTESKEYDDDIEKYSQKLLNSYVKSKHRIGINIEILDMKPPKKIIKDLLSNYQLSDDSDSSDDFLYSIITR